jgi:hypothetical protein
VLFSNSFTFSALPCGFTPIGEFIFRQLLNRDGMNKLFQLSVSISFTHSSDMSGSVPVYVAQCFHTFNRACLPYSPVSIVSRNRSGAAKPQ